MITIGNLSAAIDSLSGVAITYAYPAGIISGDYLLSFERMRATVGTAPSPVNALTWSEVASRGTCHKVFGAFYDGVTAAPTINPGGGNLGAIMLALRGVDPTTPVAAYSNSLLSQTSVHFPALTITTNNSLALTFSSVAAALTAVTHDASFAELYRFNSGITTLGMYLQDWLQITATSISAADLTTTPGTAASQFGVTLSINAGGAAPNYRMLLGVG